MKKGITPLIFLSGIIISIVITRSLIGEKPTSIELYIYNKHSQSNINRFFHIVPAKYSRNITIEKEIELHDFKYKIILFKDRNWSPTAQYLFFINSNGGFEQLNTVYNDPIQNVNLTIIDVDKYKSIVHGSNIHKDSIVDYYSRLMQTIGYYKIQELGSLDTNLFSNSCVSNAIKNNDNSSLLLFNKKGLIKVHLKFTNKHLDDIKIESLCRFEHKVFPG